MRANFPFHRLLCAFVALFAITSTAFSQGYVVEQEIRDVWVLVPESSGKESFSLGTVTVPGSRVSSLRIRNTSSTTQTFSGAIIGVGGDEGDFTTSGITQASGGLGGTSVNPGGTHEFSITYTPTCPSSFRAFALVGSGGTSGYNFNISGVAADSNAAIASFPSVDSKDATFIPDGSAANTALRTDFGEASVGGGSVPQETIEGFFALQNFSGAGDGPNTLGYRNARITGTHSGDFELVGLADGNLPSSADANTSLESFRIRFNPSALGERTATFSVKVTDSDVGIDGLYTFALRGEGTPTFSYTIEGSANTNPRVFNLIESGDDSPRTPDGTLFPLTDPGDTSTTFFRVTNTGDVQLTGELLTETNSGPGSIGFGGSIPVDVKAGESKVYELRFVAGDARTTTSTVSYITGRGGKFDYFFDVEGTAVGPEIQLIGNGEPIFTDSANTPSGDTGTLFVADIGGRAEQSFTLRNIGNQDMRVTRARILNLDGPFEVDGIDGSNFTLTPNAIRTFTITYNPTNAGDSLDKTFEIQTDDANEPEFTFTIRGSAVGVAELRVRGLFNNSPFRSLIDDTPLVPDQDITDYGVYGQNTPAIFAAFPHRKQWLRPSRYFEYRHLARQPALHDYRTHRWLLGRAQWRPYRIPGPLHTGWSPHQ